MKAKKYIWSMICVYMAYLTHGMQALIFSQNQVNFATKWGFDMTDPSSAAYAAGVAAVSTAIAWTGFGKFISVWIGGEISDRVGRKKLMIGGAILYIICFATMFVTNNATVAAIMGLLGGIATSGFWDASGYPAVQEAYPAAPGSALIMIKFFVALSSIFYPLICVQTAAAGNWKINIVIPLVLSCVVLVFACIARFVYDDEKAANAGSGSDKRADQAEIDAAKEKIDAGCKVGIICTDESRSRYPQGEVRSIGARKSQESVAHNLYALLREFDDLKVDYIFSESFTQDHLGQAIMNRLSKAAGYQIYKV